MNILKQAIKEKARENKEFVILKADRYAVDDSNINIRLFVGENLKLGPFNNFNDLDNYVKEAVGNTGNLIINDVSIIVADWYDFDYCWIPHPPKELYYDIFSDNISSTYLSDTLLYTHTEQSFSVNELIKHIDEFNKSLQQSQIISNNTVETLFLYSKLLYYVYTEPNFDVEDMNKKHVKIYYK